MPPVLQTLVQAMGTRWAALPDRARWLILVGAGVAGLTGALLLVLVSRPVNFQLLFANLPAEDAAAVTDALRQAGIPYRVDQNGSEILVPQSQVHQWRLKLASQGLPNGSGPGFELFDKAQFGTTDFTQRLNFQRALQGELGRTVSQLREVVQARVHLAMPAPRLFTTQDQPASASVVIRLMPGAVLRPDQVRGIVHLVSGAVEGLPPDKVTVLDTSGRVLGSGTDHSTGGLSRGQLDARIGLESEIERRVQTLLDHIVGVGGSAVRVAAQVNFDRVELTEERFDPNAVIRQESNSNEVGEGTSSRASGAPGTEAQTTPAQENEVNNRSQREAKQVTYEISRTVQKTVVAPGELQHLSVAVLLDTPVAQGKRAARKPEELERIRRLVVSAAGIQANRGDRLEVVEIPFDPSATPEQEPLIPEVQPAPLFPTWMPMALLLLVGVAVILMLMRNRRQRQVLEAAAGASAVLHAGTSGARGDRGADGAEEDESPLEPLEITQRKRDLLKEQIVDVAKDHPEETIQVLRAWMTTHRTPAR